MPFQTQVCLKLFDSYTQKWGYFSNIYIAHPSKCQSNIIRKILKNTLCEQTSIFKTNDNPGRNQIMNIAHRRPIALKFHKMISDTSPLSDKLYVRPLVEKLQRIKVRYFEDFMHH